MAVERHPGSLRGLSDDQLGTVSVSVVVAELEWIPDVAPVVMERISRDAVTYPEHFDRRTHEPPRYETPPPPDGRSARRTVVRLAVIAAILILIIGLVLFAATASASAVSVSLPIGEIDGTLDVRRILLVVTEAS